MPKGEKPASEGPSLKNFGAKLDGKSAVILTVGLGRIGLPTAVAFARKEFRCIGVDVNRALVDSVNGGKTLIDDEPKLSELLKSVTGRGYFKATTELKEAVPQADVIVLCLPTPMNSAMDADNSYLQSVCGGMSELKKGALVCIESTISPGVVEALIAPTIEKASSMKAGRDFFIASCPERVNPSKIFNDLYSVPRVIGGLGKTSTEMAAMLYEHVFGIKIIKVKDCKTANAAKLTENVFRYVNIAYVTELAFVFDRMGIDIREVVDACSTKYNFVPHYPSTGVGGPCLPVNTYQILRVAGMSKAGMPLLDSARGVNEQAPAQIVEYVRDELKSAKKSLKGAVVAVFGVTYKPDVVDIRVSPVEAVIKHLKEAGAAVRVHDPMINAREIFSCANEKDHAKALKGSDVLLIGTPHSAFRNMDFEEALAGMSKPAIVIDPAGSLAAKKMGDFDGITYRRIGERRSKKNADLV